MSPCVCVCEVENTQPIQQSLDQAIQCIKFEDARIIYRDKSHFYGHHT